MYTIHLGLTKEDFDAARNSPRLVSPNDTRVPFKHHKEPLKHTKTWTPKQARRWPNGVVIYSIQKKMTRKER